MSRQFKTIADAVPRLMAFDRTEPHGVTVCKGFTAAETAQLMREYGKVVRYATKAHWLINWFFCRRLKVRSDIEARMAEWEKTA